MQIDSEVAFEVLPGLQLPPARCEQRKGVRRFPHLPRPRPVLTGLLKDSWTYLGVPEVY